MAPNPTLDWQKLQDVFYCLRPCYDKLNWSIDNLQGNYRVALSQYASLIAIASKFVPHPNIIEVYTTSGNKVYSIVYNSTPSDHIIDYQFHGENLVVVLNNDRFRYYSDFKGNFQEYSYMNDLISIDNLEDTQEKDLQAELAEYESKHIVNLENNEIEEIIEILSVEIWENYMILRLANKFIIVDLVERKNYQFYYKIPNIHSFTIFEQNDKITLAICSDNTIISIKVDMNLLSYEKVDNELTDGPFNYISASPNNLLIALFNKTSSAIYVIDSNFQQIYLQYDTSDSAVPYQMEWCGVDAIVLSLRDELRLIGPSQQSISFFYDVVDEDFNLDLMLNNSANLTFTIPILKTQADGLKVITNNKLEFLSLVSPEFRNLYLIGSDHPSRTLLECIDKQAQHASKADTSLSLLKKDGTLEVAMENCLAVAIQEFNQYWQKKILLALSFGKAYCDNGYNADEYLRTINYLKVLNQLRAPEIGLFVTYKEIKQFEGAELIEMLLKRDQYLLALKVIELLNINKFKDMVYIYWCCYKIKKELSMSDVDLLAVVAKKLISSTDSKQNYITVDNIVDTAHEEGRINLCKLLINLEPSFSRKINQLLRFEEVEFALITAFRSCDIDLAMVVLLFLQETLSISQFFKILSQNERKGLVMDTSVEEMKKLDLDIVSEVLPVSGNLISHFWIHNIGRYDTKLLDSYYRQEDKKQELSMLKLKGFIKDSSNSKKDTYYEDYKLKLNKMITRSSDRRATKAYQRELDTLELQKKLGEMFQVSFYEDRSLMQILFRLITMHQTKYAAKVVKDFHIQPEKYWYMVLTTYCDTKDFNRLHQFIFKSSDAASLGNTKTPIGFLPIINAAFKHGAPAEHISDYIKNYSTGTYVERIGLYLKNNDLKSAATEAYLNKDITRLRQYATSTDGTELQSLIKGYITKLGY